MTDVAHSFNVRSRNCSVSSDTESQAAEAAPRQAPVLQGACVPSDWGITDIIHTDGLHDQVKAGRNEADLSSRYDRPQENHLMSSPVTLLQNLAPWCQRDVS